MTGLAPAPIPEQRPGAAPFVVTPGAQAGGSADLSHMFARAIDSAARARRGPHPIVLVPDFDPSPDVPRAPRHTRSVRPDDDAKPPTDRNLAARNRDNHDSGHDFRHPDPVKPNPAHRDLPHRESTPPESGRPESAPPESGRLESAPPESARPESERPESEWYESARYESARSQSGPKDLPSRESASPESVQYESVQYKSSQGESAQGDSARRDGGSLAQPRLELSTLDQHVKNVGKGTGGEAALTQRDVPIAEQAPHDKHLTQPSAPGPVATSQPAHPPDTHAGSPPPAPPAATHFIVDQNQPQYGAARAPLLPLPQGQVPPPQGYRVVADLPANPTPMLPLGLVDDPPPPHPPLAGGQGASPVPDPVVANRTLTDHVLVDPHRLRQEMPTPAKPMALPGTAAPFVSTPPLPESSPAPRPLADGNGPAASLRPALRAEIVEDGRTPRLPPVPVAALKVQEIDAPSPAHKPVPVHKSTSVNKSAPPPPTAVVPTGEAHPPSVASPLAATVLEGITRPARDHVSGPPPSGQRAAVLPAPALHPAAPSPITPVHPGGPGEGEKVAPHPRHLAETTAKISQQVAVRIHKAFTQGMDRVSIQLHPAELGRVDVHLDVRSDHRVAASIVVDRQETLDMLQRDVRGLEQALRDAGLKADSGGLHFFRRGTQDTHNPFNPDHDGQNAADDAPTSEGDTTNPNPQSGGSGHRPLGVGATLDLVI